MLFSVVNQIRYNFCRSSSLDDLAIQLSSIKSKVKALLRTLQKNPRYSDVKQLPEIEFRSSTLHQATKAKIMHCICKLIVHLFIIATCIVDEIYKLVIRSVTC